MKDCCSYMYEHNKQLQIKSLKTIGWNRMFRDGFFIFLFFFSGFLCATAQLSFTTAMVCDLFSLSTAGHIVQYFISILSQRSAKSNYIEIQD